MIFLKLALAGHMTLFVTRSRRPFWKRPFAAPILVGAMLGTQTAAVRIVAFGWFVTPIPWLYIGGVWTYCIAWIFIEDAAKLIVHRRLEHDSRRHARFLKMLGGSMHAQGR